MSEWGRGGGAGLVDEKIDGCMGGWADGCKVDGWGDG